MNLWRFFTGRRVARIRSRLAAEFKEAPHVLAALPLVPDRDLLAMERAGHHIQDADIEQLAALATHSTIELQATQYNGTPEVESCIAELIEIGRIGGGDYRGGVETARRTREIGERLYALGGFTLMTIVHIKVKSRLGSGAARHLESAWNGIGTWRG